MLGRKKLSILGTRGIPANHGGFETFAERLALYLTEKGWVVTVYCQSNEHGTIRRDAWRGVQRVWIPSALPGPLGTILFDWRSTCHAVMNQYDDLILTLGYNTAIFSLLYKLRSMRNVINMDGLEWKRAKWPLPHKIWLWINERLGCIFGDHLIADHPRIEDHLATRVRRNKITMIPYGADEISESDVSLILKLGLEPQKYAVVIARPEPENSLLEIVRAFSSKKRIIKLVLLGSYDDRQPYHARVMAAASEDVIFLGAIYDKSIVSSIRKNALLYIHGHQVGGTNPSLVEAMGAGSPILAHDNQFNTWVAGEKSHYFIDEVECAGALDLLLNEKDELESMSDSSRLRFRNNFTWASILNRYEILLNQQASINK